MTYQSLLLRDPAHVSVRKARQGISSWGGGWPKVSIHLPICNAPPQMVRATLDALAALDYDRFEVLVIDSNTPDPQLWEPVAEHCARLGPKFRFFTLGQYQGFRAGALNFALRETAPDADIIGVIGSDDIVAPNWLRATAPAFADPKLGFVQSPRDYRDRDGSLFKRLMFQACMATRSACNTIMLVRKQALLDARGWAEWCIIEDAELGLRLRRAGYAAAYAQKRFGKGLMPDDFAAFRQQHDRRAYGAMRILRANAGSLFNPFDRELTLGQSWDVVADWLPWIGDALGLVLLAISFVWSAGLMLGAVPWPVPIALFILLTSGLFAFKIVRIFPRRAKRVPCGGGIGAAVAGLALSHSAGKAVWRGLFTNRPPPLRTPKKRGAPALVQGLAMAREEVWFLLLIWGALLGVGLCHHGAALETKLWCAVLFTQSLPYLAAVGVSILAMPSGRSGADDGEGAGSAAGPARHGRLPWEERKKFRRAGQGRASFPCGAEVKPGIRPASTANARPGTPGLGG